MDREELKENMICDLMEIFTEISISNEADKNQVEKVLNSLLISMDSYIRNQSIYSFIKHRIKQWTEKN